MRWPWRDCPKNSQDGGTGAARGHLDAPRDDAGASQKLDAPAPERAPAPGRGPAARAEVNAQRLRPMPN
eukprot:3366147-Lingulodinium_polyedra.AAC.1